MSAVADTYTQAAVHEGIEVTRTSFNFDETDFSVNLEVIENAKCTVIIAVVDEIHFNNILSQAKYDLAFLRSTIWCSSLSFFFIRLDKGDCSLPLA